MPTSELIVRSLPLTILAVSGLYVAVSQLRARSRRRSGQSGPGVYLGSREQAGDLGLAWWRQLSTEQQAAHDRAVIDATAEAETDAREAAGQLAVESAARTHTLYRP